MNPTPTRSLSDDLREAAIACRKSTLALYEGIDATTFCRQAHPEFSPVGWHLGHIAFIEARWILEGCAGQAPLFPQYRTLFAADGLPKVQRQNLPDFPVILDYLHTVRSRVLDYLETAAVVPEERLWRWLIQHESQHAEIVAFILQLHRTQKAGIASPPASRCATPTETILVPAGEFYLGWDAIEAQDHECPARWLHLDSFEIDRYPVTCAQYWHFIEAGGYREQKWWSEAGWQWLQANPVDGPLYATDSDDCPVCGVSAYEAEAYANFVGKRLPTEAEWEKAASWDAALGKKLPYPWGIAPPDASSCNSSNRIGRTTSVSAYPQGKSPYGCEDMLGNVWEWTASTFEGYPGFEFYPYRGYSEVYFDGEHRVLRGGSWATQTWTLRASFRNWYYPSVRQILAGFRCAQSR